MKKENQPLLAHHTPARPRRRFLLACTTAVAGLALLPLRALAESLAARFSVSAIRKETDVEAAIARYTDGAETTESTELIIRLPQIAENGNVVPVEVNATGVPGGVDQLAFFIANNPTPAQLGISFWRGRTVGIISRQNA